MHNLSTIAGFLPILIVSLSGAEQAPVEVTDSGSEVVDRIVRRLVSLSPAPLPTGSPIYRAVDHRYVRKDVDFMTPEVKEALDDLARLSPKDYPFLVRHIDDDRYCHGSNAISAPMEGCWISWTVGDAIREMLSNDLDWTGGYKWRTVGDQGWATPKFAGYVEANGGFERWASFVAAMQRSEIDLAFLDWAIAEERKRGFSEAAEEARILERYDSKRREIERSGNLRSNRPNKSE